MAEKTNWEKGAKNISGRNTNSLTMVKMKMSRKKNVVDEEVKR